MLLRPFRCGGANLGDFFCHLCRRLTPGQIFVGDTGRELDPGIGGAAEIKRRTRFLHRWQAEPGTLCLDIFAVEISLASFDQRIEHLEELVSVVVTLVVRQEDAITSQLLRAAANDDVEKQPTMGNTVQRGGQPRIIGRRGNARTDGDEEFQFLGIGGEIGREDEGSFRRRRRWE